MIHGGALTAWLPLPGVFSQIRFRESAAPFSSLLEVTWAELALAVQRLKAESTTTGLDGIPGRAWVLALDDVAPVLEPQLRGLFSLEQGRFPKLWKTRQ